MSTPAIHANFGEDIARARRTDPTTSHEAADVSDVTTSIGAVLDLLREEGPMIDERIEARLTELGYTFTGERYRTARKALEKKNLVHHNGHFDLTSRGRRSQVWAAGPEPVEAEQHLAPVLEDRRCGACGAVSVVEVDRWSENGHVFEAWKCLDDECGIWNDREARP